MNDRQPAIAIGPAQNERPRAGLGQAKRATDCAIDFQQSVATSANARGGGQHQVIRDHKTAGAILLQAGSQAGQGNGVADDVLRSRRTIGQIDLLGDQAAEIIAGGVSLAAGTTEVEHHVGLADCGRGQPLPIGARGKGAAEVVPDEVGRVLIIDHQVIAGLQHGPEAVERIAETCQIQEEIVRIEPRHRRRGGEGEIVGLLIDKIRRQPGPAGKSQTVDINDKRIGGRGGDVEVPQHLNLVGTLRSQKIIDPPCVLAAAG